MVTWTSSSRNTREVARSPTTSLPSPRRRRWGGNAAALAKALEGFARMYELHTAIEDTVIFPAWKKTMSSKELDEMGDKFEDIEHATFGKDGFDDAVEKVTGIERTLGLSDLAQFTAAPPPKGFLTTAGLEVTCRGQLDAPPWFGALTSHQRHTSARHALPFRSLDCTPLCKEEKHHRHQKERQDRRRREPPRPRGRAAGWPPSRAPDPAP